MNDIASPEHQALGSKALRMRRAKRLAIALAAFVLLPTVMAIAYYGFLVRPQYESVAVLALSWGKPSDADKQRTTGHDLAVVRERIVSRAMMDTLIEKHGLLEHFRHEDGDRWTRLSSDASNNETFDYYQKHVVAELDGDGTLELRVFAFSGEVAHSIADAIVAEAENHLAERAELTRVEALEGAAAKVAAAEERLRKTPNSDMVEMEVARLGLAAAHRARERAEADLALRQRTMWVVSPPSTPDRPSRPRRLWSIATVFVTALSLGGIALFLIDFVREHAKF